MTEKEEKYNFRAKTKLKRLRKIRKGKPETKAEADAKTEPKTKTIAPPMWFKVVQFQQYPRIKEIEAPEIQLNGKVHLGVREKLITMDGWDDFELLLLLKLNQCFLFHVPVTNKFVRRMGELIARIMGVRDFEPTACWIARMRKKVLREPINIINFHLDDEKLWNKTQPSGSRVAMSQCDMFELIKKELRTKKIGKYTISKKDVKIPKFQKERKSPARQIEDIPTGSMKQYANRKCINGGEKSKNEDGSVDCNDIVMDIKVEPETLQEFLPPADGNINLPEEAILPDINLPEPNFKFPSDGESTEKVVASINLKPVQKKPEMKSQPVSGTTEKILTKSPLKLVPLQRKKNPQPNRPPKAKKNSQPKPQKEGSPQKPKKNPILKAKRGRPVGKAKSTATQRVATLHNYFGPPINKQGQSSANDLLNGTAVEKKTTITNAQGETFEITIFEDSFDPSFQGEASDAMYPAPMETNLQYQTDPPPASYCTSSENSLTAIPDIPVFIKSEKPSDVEPTEFSVPTKDMLLGL